MHRCPKCVERDLKDFGFAHWHIHHQLRQVRHCLEHRCVLESACVLCGARFISKVRSEGADVGCAECGCAPGAADPDDEIQVSPGYWMLLELLQGCLQGRSAMLKRYPLRVFNAYRKRESLEQVDLRIAVVLEYFGASNEASLSRLLGCPIDRDELRSIFQVGGRTDSSMLRIQKPALWMALCAYSHHESHLIAEQAAERLSAARADARWDYVDLPKGDVRR